MNGAYNHFRLSITSRTRSITPAPPSGWLLYSLNVLAAVTQASPPWLIAQVVFWRRHPDSPEKLEEEVHCDKSEEETDDIDRYGRTQDD